MNSGDEPVAARLDSDDLALPGRLAAQRAYLEENPDVVLVGTMADRIDSRGTVLGPFATRPGDRIRARLLDSNPLIHSSVMFRRSAYESAGGYDPKLRHMEDYDLWLRMARFGEATVLPDVLVAYRIHDRQITKNVAILGAPLAAATRWQLALGATLGIRALGVHRRRARWWVIQYGMTANSMLNRWRFGLASRARDRS